MKEKAKKQLPPALQTRAANKFAHPASHEVLGTTPRRTSEQMEEHRRKTAEEKATKANQVSQSKAKAAEVEDRIRQEDLQREAVANHPPKTSTTVFKAPLKISETQKFAVLLVVLDRRDASPSRSDVQDSGASGNEFRPKSSDEETDDGELDMEEETEQLAQPKKRGPPKKPRREDITALRTVSPASGAPGKRKIIDPGLEPPSKKKKSEKNKAGALIKNWDLAHKKSRAVATTTSEEDDSLVRYGGYVDDDDDDEAEKDASRISGLPAVRGRKPLPSLIKIKYNTHTASTKKEIRGGDTKWALKHLPKGSSDEFTSAVVPLAIAKVGTLPPWTNLSTEEVQSIVDTVYGDGVHDVHGQAGVVWTALVSYRLSNWRNGFGRFASQVVASYFEEFADDPNAIAEGVAWFLDFQGEKFSTAPYQWREWKDAAHKKGFCGTSMIVKTFALAHLAGLDDLEFPNPKWAAADMPSGALILSLQAVERALNEFKSGFSVPDKLPKGKFSADNWGDYEERKKLGSGKFKTVTHRRASRYISTIHGFMEKHWAAILDEGKEYLEEASTRGRRKSGRSSSRASSEAVEVEEDFVLQSDPSDDEDLASEHMSSPATT